MQPPNWSPWRSWGKCDLGSVGSITSQAWVRAKAVRLIEVITLIATTTAHNTLNTKCGRACLGLKVDCTKSHELWAGGSLSRAAEGDGDGGAGIQSLRGGDDFRHPLRLTVLF